jgi:diguanylate cyclase (GGDEF)-like protein
VAHSSLHPSGNEPGAPAGDETVTILIIEDTQGVREELCRVVESLGYRAIGAQSGLEGLRLVRDCHPSLVLLDVVMPSLDGYKVASLIKAQPGFTPVVLLTGLNDLDSKRRGQAAGADDFVTKPVVPLELNIRIAAMLRIKALHNQLDAANRRLAELAETDPLTALANRRGFDVSFGDEFARARRYRRELALLMVDIDHFKKVNDQHGHPVGDQVLRAVAQTLASEVRQSDRVGRLGGEEFAVLAPEINAPGALTLAERLRRAVEELNIPIGNGSLRVTISIGVNYWNGLEEVEMSDLLKHADEALYKAKQGGRNRSLLAPPRNTK